MVAAGSTRLLKFSYENIHKIAIWLFCWWLFNVSVS